MPKYIKIQTLRSAIYIRINSFMKPRFFKKIFLLIFLSSFLTPLFTAAITFENPLEGVTFESLVSSVIDFIFWVAMAIAPIMIIVAAFYFLTSAGDPEKVRTAKRIIFWTIVGLIIVLSGRGIVAMIEQILFPPPPPPTAVCGNNVIEGTEQCDDGAGNTNTPCTPAYGGSCTYCDTSCVSHTVQGAYCGDGTCDSGFEDYSSCPADCPPTDCTSAGGWCFASAHNSQCNLACSPKSGSCDFTTAQCGTDCCCICY